VEEVRVTDLDKEIAKKRYLFFKDTTFESLKILREKFYYHFIDASPDTETVKQSLLKELKYQRFDTFKMLTL
jgi:adenylate kinase